MFNLGPALLLILFILINAAIWFIGPLWTYHGAKPLITVSERLMVMMIFSIICIAMWGYAQWKKLQKYHAKQEQEERFRQDPIKVYEERQEKELNRVVTNMTKSFGHKDSLYVLPWFVVLGVENAGKTSLINRSGQKFSFSTAMKASGQKSENPYSFDWWIGDKGVLIDPDGELLTQGNRDEDNDGELERRLWKHFVEWLDKTRNRRPLNGIVLAIDIAHLSTARASERKAYANMLRARIRELVETLAIRLPVYITLTKLDLLYGFEPIFKNYSKEQREAALGFTFELNPEEENVDAWLELFEKEYAGFVERLNDLVPTATLKSSGMEERNAIYSFSRQIAGLQSILKEFFQEALSSDQFSTPALVRGVYFTSVYQQGVPTNAFDDAASRRYGLSHAVNRAQNAKNSSIYFAPKLFSNIIYNESGLANDNRRVVKQKRRLVGLSVAVCSVATLILFGYWQRYYSVNVNHAEAVISKVNEFKHQLPPNIYAASQKDILTSLNKIREATFEFGYFRDKSKYFSEMGLYQGHTIGPKVEKTYLDLLEARFLPILMADVIIKLNQAQTEDDKLAALRVYRMMTDKQGRYNDIVMDYFSRYWAKEFPGKRTTQEQLMGHLAYAMDHTDLAKARKDGDEIAEQIMRPYDTTIATVQTELGSVPTEERVYRNLKLNSQTVLGPAINLRSLVGPVFDMVFEEKVATGNGGLYIPAMLTKNGFDSYFVPQIKEVSELALIDSWVLGISKTAEFSEADKQALRDKIRELYVKDYTDTWQEALAEVDVKYFNDINDAVTVLDNLTGSVEPLQRLLRTLGSNTELYADLPEDEDAREEVLKTPKYRVASEIDSPFSELNGMLKPVGSKPAYINEVLNSVDELKLYLKTMQSSPDMGMAALEATKARMKLVNTDPIYTLKRVASGLPKPLDEMMTKLANESWYVVRQEAMKYLEKRWHDDVYVAYRQKLAGRYPFNPASRKDASLEDFADFFAPNGVLDKFYNDQLKVFIDERSYGNEDEEQNGEVIKPQILAEIKRAKRIQSAFFNRKGVLDVNFAVEPMRLSGNKRRSVLNVDGQFLLYSHGSRENVELIWPNTLRDSAVSKITLIPTKTNIQPRSITIQGPWAFFRLLDQGDVVSASNTSVDYKFTVDGGDMVYRINSEADANPFTQPLFKSFRISSTLY
ncbi:type VI secretion system membrane subunit TssM [Vibrio sp.]|nr:type VI secretion system membrane subunit TssM [Vibrio viridaestus]MDC0612211.1 type VI secretion system membrane subunit TssM [Vibrio sp.]